jgi:hypothetical protein
MYCEKGNTKWSTFNEIYNRQCNILSAMLIIMASRSSVSLICNKMGEKQITHFQTGINSLSLCGFSPRANAAFRRRYCQLLQIRGVLGGQRGRSLRPYSRFSRQEPLLFLSSSSSIVLTRLSILLIIFVVVVFVTSLI